MSMVVRSNLILFVCAFVVGLILCLPLRLAIEGAGLDDSGLSARDSRGSLWSGTLRDAQIGPIKLGDLNAHLSPAQLLLARVALNLSDDEGGRGRLIATPWTFGFDEVDTRFTAAGLLSPLPLTAFEMEGVSAVFGSGRCVEAGGLVRAQVSPVATALGLSQTFIGNPRCSGSSLLVPLASQRGRERIDLRIESTGHYQAMFRARPADPALAAQLEAAGFTSTSRGHALVARGRF